ncbi:radical SAM protein [Candidatus Omnitrophota bacterium]
MIKNKPEDYKYIYGPVSSWRLGRSLGVDPISRKEKICSFDCVYCQVGKTDVLTDKREIFVPTDEIIKEIKLLPKTVDIDYVTFSGRGEPTLAINLGEMIREIKKIRKEKIAVITDSSLIERMDVQNDLSMADLVMVKLDACSEEVFNKVNRPLKGITLSGVIKGIKAFKSGFKGKLAVQIMFIDENKNCAKELARVVKEISPDEVELNTPLRPCGIKPLHQEDLQDLKKYFKGMNIVSLYDAKKKKTSPINKDNTLRRRGAYD